MLMQPEVADQRFREMYQATERDVLAYFLRRTDATSARDGAAETFLVAWSTRVGTLAPTRRPGTGVALG